MSETGIAVNKQTAVEKEIAEAEAVQAQLQEKLAAVREQLAQRQGETAEAAGAVDCCRAVYQEECRKFARAEKAEVSAARTALHEAEARLEGLRLLLADEEARIAGLREESAPVEAKLQELRYAQKVEVERAEIAAMAESVQRSLDALRGQAREIFEKLLKGQWTGEENQRTAGRRMQSIDSVLGSIRDARVV
jgi:chromosome segregation ATPase